MDVQQQQQKAAFETLLGRQLFNTQVHEKSHTDKLLARGEVAQVQNIIKKEDLTRSELLELLYLLSSSEIKLANFGDWDRYLLGKFLTWIRDFVSIAEILYDYREHYHPKEGEEKKLSEKEKRIDKLMENNRKMMLHNIKFLVDIYLYLSRSTLSLTMAGFQTLSTQRYEYAYPNVDGIYPKEEQGKSMFSKLSLR